MFIDISFSNTLPLMRNIRIIFYVIILFFQTSLINKNHGDLTIKVTGIKEISGRIKMGLYNSSQTFANSGQEFRKAAVVVSKNTAIIVFKNLPEGEYAIAFYHDQNGDNDLNRNFIGLPKEGYGFSNNISPKLSVPSFDQTKFKFPELRSLEIKTIY